MNGVVLRCPVCGTTQSQPGECDACSDGNVRYFCGNHTPGVWLDGPLCRECGAQFGDAPAGSATSPPSAAPSRPVHKTRRPDASPPPRAGAEPRRTVRRARRPAGRPVDRPAAPSLRDLLEDLGDGGERTGYTVELPRYERVPEPPRRSPFVLGCLLRIVLLVVLLIVLVVFGLFLLVGGALQ